MVHTDSKVSKVTRFQGVEMQGVEDKKQQGLKPEVAKVAHGVYRCI